MGELPQFFFLCPHFLCGTGLGAALYLAAQLGLQWKGFFPCWIFLKAFFIGIEVFCVFHYNPIFLMPSLWGWNHVNHQKSSLQPRHRGLRLDFPWEIGSPAGFLSTAVPRPPQEDASSLVPSVCSSDPFNNMQKIDRIQNRLIQVEHLILVKQAAWDRTERWSYRSFFNCLFFFHQSKVFPSIILIVAHSPFIGWTHV